MNLATTVHLPVSAPRRAGAVATSLGRTISRHPRATVGSAALLAAWIGLSSLVRRRRNHDVTDLFRSEPPA